VVSFDPSYIIVEEFGVVIIGMDIPLDVFVTLHPGNTSQFAKDPLANSPSTECWDNIEIL